MSHPLGWVCAVAMTMDKGIKGQWAQLSREHGICELYEGVEDGPFCERTKEELVTVERTHRNIQKVRAEETIIKAAQRLIDHDRMNCLIAARGEAGLGDKMLFENCASCEEKELDKALKDLGEIHE